MCISSPLSLPGPDSHIWLTDRVTTKCNMAKQDLMLSPTPQTCSQPSYVSDMSTIHSGAQALGSHPWPFSFSHRLQPSHQDYFSPSPVLPTTLSQAFINSCLDYSNSLPPAPALVHLQPTLEQAEQSFWKCKSGNSLANQWLPGPRFNPWLGN